MDADRQWILEALQRNGGSWDAWSQKLKPFLDEIKAKVDAAPEHRLVQGNYTIIGEPPTADPSTFVHITDIRAVPRLVAFRDELRKRGIDLIAVPVPHKHSFTCRKFSDKAPADGIVKPQYLHFILELLDHDVEVLNITRALLESEAKNEFPFYFNYANDHHWADGGRIVGARLVAQRLKRYGFAAHFTDAALEIKTVLKQRNIVDLNDSFARNREYPCTQVWVDGKPVISETNPSLKTPVVLIGDSMLDEFTWDAGLDFTAYLAWQARIFPVRVNAWMNLHTDPADIIMNRLAKAPGIPGIIEGRRVLVFVFWMGY
jgi:hypothetical protein